ncbi:MAG: O-antigen ligase family protein [Kiritimatiellae bacterium]|nr:O-antigen ligase family protein [Kiritimatiellia bacterium]
MLKTNPFMRLVAKDIAYLVLAIILLRLSKGAFVFLIVLASAAFSLHKKGGAAVACFVSLFFLQNVNFAIVPATVMMNIGCKIGIAIIGMSMVVANAPKSRYRLPLGGLAGYMIWMSISSAQGYFPLISYLKILNYSLFLLAIGFSVRYMQLSRNDAMQIRAMFLAIAFIMVIGSIMTLPFPSIAYSRQLEKAASYGIEITGEMLLASDEMSLFNGLSWHSQALAPMVAITALFVGCDMLFIEKRFTLIHIAILAVSPVEMFMTRSRTALSTAMIGGLVLVFYAVKNAAIPLSLKKNVRSLTTIFIVLGLIGLVVLQLHDQGLDKWLRKTEDVQTDDRTLGEAITSTRMASIEMNIDDFKRSPVLGTGFQVMFFFPYLYQHVPFTSLLSAPCEKGETPLVVFAEGGVVGGTLFYIFVIAFYAYCVRRKLVCLLTLFTAQMVSNFSESTFFSPTGAGGYLWIFTMLGGMTLDYIVATLCDIHDPRYNIDTTIQDPYRVGR